MTYNVNESMIHRTARHVTKLSRYEVADSLTEETLHHLGWLYANVRFSKKKGYGWSATLYINDVACEEGHHYSREQLQAILEYIGLDHNVTANARNRIYIRSVPLARLLIDHFHLSPDKERPVPEVYAKEPAFWGGYIEQNGMPGVYFPQNGTGYWYIDVQGSVALLEQLHQFLVNQRCPPSGISSIVRGKHIAEMSLQNHTADQLIAQIEPVIIPYCNKKFWNLVASAKATASAYLMS